MGNLLPSLGRRKLPMLEMPKLGGGVVSGGLGAIIYASAQPDSSYALCDGSYIPYPSKAGFPFPGIAATNQINTKTLPGVGNVGTGYVYSTVKTPDGKIYVSSASGIYVSLDGGSTFNLQTISPALIGLNTLAYGNGVFILTSQSTGRTYRSTDGVNYTQVINTTYSQFATDGNGNWVAVKAGSSLLYSTNNGANWVGATNLSNNHFISTVAYIGGGIFVMCGYDNTINPARSLVFAATFNGSNFTYDQYSMIYTPYPGGAGLAAYGNGRLVVTIGGGMFISKADPVLNNFGSVASWQQSQPVTPNGAYYGSVKFCKDRFFAAAASDQIAASFDGLSWSLLSGTVQSNAVYEISFIEGLGPLFGANNSSFFEVVVSSYTFKLPVIQTYTGITGKTLNPYMKVA